MTLEEAIQKASSPVQPAQATNQPDPYAIPFEVGETIKNMVGKTISSKANANTMTIEKWIGQNFVLRIDGGDNYAVSPAMWILQNANSKKITIS